ncbi:MAG: hypothetical protein KBT47_04820 [Armatimonadetes bacterium]|nr:hypothetical protein [Candidatus Hippobium faecium]
MKKLLTLFLILIISAISLSLYAEINPDTDILKRTPTIDGNITKGEWDIFYKTETVTAYANWDFNNFYVGATADRIISVALVMDAKADGWNIGDDNFLVKQNENGDFDVLKAVRNSDSDFTMVAIEIPEPYKIKCQKSTVNGKENIELAIPAYFFGLSNYDTEKFNFNFSVETEEGVWSSFNPNTVKDYTLCCKAVNHKTYALSPLDIELYVTKERVVAGDTLDGRIKIKNRSKEPVTVKEIIMAGEGLAEDIVSSYKIKVGVIKPGKTFEREYHSRILPDTPEGCRVLGCEVFSEDMKVGGALRSFEIIEKSRFKPYVPKEVCFTSDKVIRVGVRVISFSEKKYSDGYASITVPEGWELEGNNKNKYRIMGYNKYVDLIFRLTPPLGAVGHYRIPVTITHDDTESTVFCEFDIVQSK